MRSTARRPGVGGPAVLLILLLGFVLAACGAAGMAAPGASAGAPGPVFAGGDGDGNDNGNGTGNGNGSGSGANPAPIDLLIIKTGEMTLQVAGIDAAVTAAGQHVAALGGYASASRRAGDGESAFASITFRIPADRWDEALAGLRGLAEKVLDEQTGTEDVTSQVVDLAARIRNLQATELALQEIMARATDIEDVLAVQAELTQVREQIERLEAQKGDLEERAAYSTLTVGFQTKPTPVLTAQEQFDPSTEVDRASASLVGILQALATAGIWFGIVWLPILVVLAVAALIGLAIWRRLQRGRDAAPATPVVGGGA